jgi:hypothetical protein
MTSMRILVRAGAGLAAALLLAPAAGALDITGLSVVKTASNLPADSTSLPANASQLQVASSTNVVLNPIATGDTVGSNVIFTTQYAALIAADMETTSGNGTATQNLTSDYTITFTVDNPTGASYDVVIDTSRIGALTIVGDDARGTSTATATIGAVVGSVDAVVNGSLALATLGLTNTSSTTSAFNQTSTTLTLSDNAVSRTFVLGFSWTNQAFSAKDEAAVRMGIDGSLNPSASTTTADNYSLDGRNVSGDGHFVTVSTTITSTPVPEPAPAALIGFGLIGLAVRRRSS